MKKIKILFLLLLCTMFSFAQTNLLTNPSFETWTNGTAPDGWNLPVNTYATVSQNTTLFNDGISSLKVTPAPVAYGGTYSINQFIPVTVGKTYILKISYYIETGDGTDARIWCNFKNGAVYLTDAEMTSAGLLEKLKGPGGSSATFYFPDVKGSWQTYTTEFVAPSGVTDFGFEFRTYKEPAIVYWDNMFFGEKITTDINAGLNDVKSNLNLTIINKQLVISEYTKGLMLNIFTPSGVNVYSSELIEGVADIKNLGKGVYIVSYNNKTNKITILY